jgi:hypothetical protein
MSVELQEALALHAAMVAGTLTPAAFNADGFVDSEDADEEEV